MSYDFRKWTENEGFGRSRKLRAAYTAPFLLFPISLAIEFGDGFGSPWLAVLGSLLAVIAIFCAILVIGSPFLRDAWRSSRRSSGTLLDERERGALREGLASAYYIVAAALLLALTYADLAPGFGWWTPGRDELEALQFPLFAMIATLPVTMAEWSVPLPPEGDEE